jgi:hypothetical protein
MRLLPKCVVIIVNAQISSISDAVSCSSDVRILSLRVRSEYLSLDSSCQLPVTNLMFHGTMCLKSFRATLLQGMSMIVSLFFFLVEMAV